MSYVENTEHNITFDNFFNSDPPTLDLLSKRLTIIGTMGKNKRYIPHIMKPSQSRAVYSSEFGFSGNMAMESYVPNKNKSVFLLSTMHQDKAISDCPKSKLHNYTLQCNQVWCRYS